MYRGAKKKEEKQNVQKGKYEKESTYLQIQVCSLFIPWLGNDREGAISCRSQLLYNYLIFLFFVFSFWFCNGSKFSIWKYKFNPFVLEASSVKSNVSHSKYVNPCSQARKHIIIVDWCVSESPQTHTHTIVPVLVVLQHSFAHKWSTVLDWVSCADRAAFIALQEIRMKLWRT